MNGRLTDRREDSPHELHPSRSAEGAAADLIPAASTQAGVIALQRSAGNAAVARALSSQRSIARDDASDTLEQLGEAGAEHEAETLADQSPPVLQAHTISDTNAARRLLTQIEGYDEHMREGASTRTISGGELRANEVAKARLSDYLVMGGEQGRTLSTYQEQLRRVLIDSARIRAQVTHLQLSGLMPREGTAAEATEAMVGAVGLGGSQRAGARITSDMAGMMQTQAEQQHQTLIEKSNAVSSAQSETTQAVYAFNTALQGLRAGIVTRETSPELVSEQTDLTEAVNRLQGRVAFGLQVLTAVGGAAGVTASGLAARLPAGAARTLGERGLTAAGNALSPENIAEAFAEAVYDRDINDIRGRIVRHVEASRQAAILEQLNTVREKREDLFNEIGELKRALTEVGVARAAVRSSMDRLGDAAGRGRGRREREGYEMIAGLLGDADVLLAQIDMTRDLGAVEQRVAGDAAASRETITGSWNAEERRVEGGTHYYEPSQTFQLGNWTPWGGRRHGGLVWEALRRTIHLVPPNISAGSAVGQSRYAANPNVDASQEQLGQLREDVRGMRDTLATAMGLALGGGERGEEATEGPAPVGAETAGSAGR